MGQRLASELSAASLREAAFRARDQRAISHSNSGRWRECFPSGHFCSVVTPCPRYPPIICAATCWDTGKTWENYTRIAERFSWTQSQQPRFWGHFSVRPFIWGRCNFLAKRCGHLGKLGLTKSWRRQGDQRKACRVKDIRTRWKWQVSIELPVTYGNMAITLW